MRYLTAIALLVAQAAPALACRGPQFETYILQTERPASIPKGAELFVMDVNMKDIGHEKSIYAGLVAMVRSGRAGVRTLLIASSGWSSCTWWLASTRMFGPKDHGNPYFVVGYLFRSKDGRFGLDPVEYGFKGRTRAPFKKFATPQAYFAQIAENVRRYRRTEPSNP